MPGVPGEMLADPTAISSIVAKIGGTGSVPLNYDRMKWSAKAPPGGGGKYSPVDGCGRGVFVVF